MRKNLKRNEPNQPSRLRSASGAGFDVHFLSIFKGVRRVDHDLVIGIEPAKDLHFCPIIAANVDGLQMDLLIRAYHGYARAFRPEE